MFSCVFCKISKSTFFTEHLWTTASFVLMKLKSKGIKFTAWKVSKYRPEKTPYLDTYHTIFFKAKSNIRVNNFKRRVSGQPRWCSECWKTTKNCWRTSFAFLFPGILSRSRKKLFDYLQTSLDLLKLENDYKNTQEKEN